MFKLVILEGARGTGKSTISFKLRQKLKNSTLINFTGFNNDDQEGLEKVRNYYDIWFQLFRNMKWKVKDQIIICDRFYPSEMVFSPLYKNYDFSKDYMSFTNLLPTIADEVHLINFTISDKEELEKRLLRDKIPFWKAEESVSETFKQQEVYKNLFKDIKGQFEDSVFKDKMFVNEIDTTGREMDDIFKEVLKSIGE